MSGRATVTASPSLRVRSGASTSEAQLGSVAQGETVTLLGPTREGWYEIEGPARGGGMIRGWVSGEYLEVEPEVSVSEEDSGGDASGDADSKFEADERREVTAAELAAGVELSAERRYLFVAPSPKIPALALSAALFGHDSAFPRPGVFVALRAVARLARRPQVRFLVFGHTDSSGRDAYNKNLSDRRARAVMSMLRVDREAFDAIALEDGWGDLESQAMLRALGCNPGWIDGIVGPLTHAATRWFQRQWNDGFHHPKGRAPESRLDTDGLPGPLTRAALRAAYVMDSPCALTAEQVVGLGYAGCGEFNLRSDDDEENRRVVIAAFGPDEPSEAPPCKPGDVSACRLTGGGRMRCSYYRTEIEEVERERGPWFSDFAWLEEDDGDVHLSALTRLADGTRVRVTVRRTVESLPFPPPALRDPGDEPPRLGEVLATLEAEVAGGVCAVRWRPPEDYDPFDLLHWDDPEAEDEPDDDDEPIDEEAAQRLMEGGRGLFPPVFVLEAEGRWAVSPPPGMQLDRLRLQGDAGPGEAIALSPFGGFEVFALEDGRLREEAERYAFGVFGLSYPLMSVWSPEEGD